MNQKQYIDEIVQFNGLENEKVSKVLASIAMSSIPEGFLANTTTNERLSEGQSSTTSGHRFEILLSISKETYHK